MGRPRIRIHVHIKHWMLASSSLQSLLRYGPKSQHHRHRRFQVDSRRGMPKKPLIGCQFLSLWLYICKLLQWIEDVHHEALARSEKQKNKRDNVIISVVSQIIQVCLWVYIHSIVKVPITRLITLLQENEQTSRSGRIRRDYYSGS